MNGIEVLENPNGTLADEDLVPVKQNGKNLKFFSMTKFWTWVWNKIQENAIGAINDSTKTSSSPVQTKAVSNALELKEDISNKVDEVGDDTDTSTSYPSVLCMQETVRDLIDDSVKDNAKTWSSNKIDSSINGALVNLSEVKIGTKSDCNLCVPSGTFQTSKYIVAYNGENVPTNRTTWVIESTLRSDLQVTQIAYSIDNNNFKNQMYIRQGAKNNNTWEFEESWEQVTTTSVLNGALANFQEFNVINKNDANICIPAKYKTATYAVYSTNCPIENVGWIIEATNINDVRVVQRAKDYKDNTSNYLYERSAVKSGDNWVWGNNGAWEQITTTSVLNGALANYLSLDLNRFYSATTAAYLLKNACAAYSKWDSTDHYLIVYGSGTEGTATCILKVKGDTSLAFLYSSYNGLTQGNYNNYGTFSFNGTNITYYVKEISKVEYEGFVTRDTLNGALANFPKIIKTQIDSNKTITLTHRTDVTNMFIWRVSVQGNISQAYASYIIQGYGAGGANRDHIFTHYQGTAITITQTDNIITITNTNTLSGVAKVVIEVLEGESPTVTTN